VKCRWKRSLVKLGRGWRFKCLLYSYYYTAHSTIRFKPDNHTNSKTWLLNSPARFGYAHYLKKLNLRVATTNWVRIRISFAVQSCEQTLPKNTLWQTERRRVPSNANGPAVETSPAASRNLLMRTFFIIHTSLMHHCNDKRISDVS